MKTRLTPHLFLALLVLSLTACIGQEEPPSPPREPPPRVAHRNVAVKVDGGHDSEGTPRVSVDLDVSKEATPARTRTAEEFHTTAKGFLEAEGDEAAQQALIVLEEGLKAHPGSEPLHRLAGIAHSRLSDWENARKSLRAAIAANPRIAFNYLKLAAIALCEEEDLPRAETILREMFEALPDDMRCREEAAQMLAGCDAADSAIGLYLDLAGRAPDHAWAYYFKAGQLFHMGQRYVEAQALLSRAMSQAPTDVADVPAQLGATLARMGRDAEAAELYAQALERNPGPGLAKRLREELAKLR